MRRGVLVVLTLSSLGGCAPQATPPAPEPPAAPAPAPPMMGMGGRGPGGMGMGRRMHQAPPPADPTDPVLQEGKKVFDEVCSVCHTLEPPPNLAPPMRMVSMHLRQSFATEEEGVAHVVAYVPAPTAERAIMPEHAIERFGLMAPLPLPPETLEKVARYVWSLGDGV